MGTHEWEFTEIFCSNFSFVCSIQKHPRKQEKLKKLNESKRFFFSFYLKLAPTFQEATKTDYINI